MKPICLMLITSLAIPAIANSQVKTDTGLRTVVVQDVQVHSVEKEDDIEGPPPHLKVKYTNLKSWLTDMVAHDKPKKHIQEFSVGMYENTGDGYTLFLTGQNEYAHTSDSSSTKIEFEPVNMYCKLPKAYYEKLSGDQLLDKITAELSAFTSSPIFKQSFFTKGERFVFKRTGKLIWSK